MKKVSVIVPVHNVADYLPRCIESLQNQIYQNIQIVLINDGSSDGSGSICDTYATKDSRITVHHQPAQGVSAARNKGLELSEGELIIFLDGDDSANEHYISRLLDNMEQYDLDISQCCLLRVKDGNIPEYIYEEKEVQLFTGLEMQMKIFERNRFFSMCLCGKLFKKELFEGLQFPVGRINEDESLIYLLMYRAQKVGIVDDFLYYYHYNGNSITEKKYNIHRLDCFYMLREKFDFYMEQGHKAWADKTANEYFSQMSVVFCHDKRQVDDYKAIIRKAVQMYKKDRKEMLSKAHLRADRKLFCILSYIWVGFVKVYGLLLKKYISIRK